MSDKIMKIIYDCLKTSDILIDDKDIGKKFVSSILENPFRYQYLIISVPDGRIIIPVVNNDPDKTLLSFGELLNTIREKYPEVWKLFEKAGIRFEKDC